MRMARVMLGLGVLFFATAVLMLWVMPERSAPTPAEPPVATVRHLMLGIVIPASTKVFDAVSYTATLDGVVETAPRTHEEWEQVAASAAAVLEGARLLAAHGPANGAAEWARTAQDLRLASRQVMAAAATQDAEAVMAAGAVMVEACQACHAVYVPNTGIR